MRKNSDLLQPYILISIGCCTAMSVAALFFSLRLFYIFGGVTLFCIGLIFWQTRRIKRDINAFLMRTGKTLTTDQQQAMTGFPLAVFVCGGSGEVLWYNQRAQDQVLQGEKSYGIDILSILKGVELAAPCPDKGYDVEYRGNAFTAYISPVLETDTEQYVVYLFENTRLKHHAREYFETRPSVILIQVDNYDELQQSLPDNERTRMMNEIQYMVSKYIGDYGGLMLKTDRDRFTAIVEERHLRNMISSRFTLIGQVREIGGQPGQTPTISVGVGREAANFAESDRYARQALDMALGRGGDQAAVRAVNGYEFFGGVSSGVEKQTKVKTRIVASALVELMNGSENVLIMGHRNADLDCFGASMGLLKAALMMNKNAHIVIRRERQLVGPLFDRLCTNGYSQSFIEPEVAMTLVGRKTLLIICDTHIPTILESPELFKLCKNTVVIDHHRKMVGHIDNAVIFYHEPYASSTSEMVAELVQYFGDRFRIGRLEAEALLAGIMLDTKNFVIRTGVRTFEAAAYLRRMGADTVEVRKLFAAPMEAYQRKVRLIANAHIYKGCAISVVPDADLPDIQVTAAQAADELLNIEMVQASILVFESNGMVCFSARSMGQINVQIIMEKLGGGGHHTMAGAQLKEVSTEQGERMLIEAIDAFFEENARPA